MRASRGENVTAQQQQQGDRGKCTKSGCRWQLLLLPLPARVAGLPLTLTAPPPVLSLVQALGMKPKAPKVLKQAQLDKGDMQKLLQGTGGRAIGADDVFVGCDWGGFYCGGVQGKEQAGVAGTCRSCVSRKPEADRSEAYHCSC